MISNPGSAQSTDLMNKSVYDKTGQNTDIFEYVDTKTSDKVSSSQVATQISEATKSFATTSYVDTKIDELKNRFQWYHVDIVPYKSSVQTITTDSAGVISFVDRDVTYFYYLVDLPYPINLYLYDYEISALCVGKKCFLTSNPSSSSNPAGNQTIHFFSSNDLTNDGNSISAIYPNGNILSVEPSEYRYYQTHGYTNKANTSYMACSTIVSGYSVLASVTADPKIILNEKQYCNIDRTNLTCDKVGFYMGRTYSSTDQRLTWKAWHISFDYRAIT